MVKKRIIPVIFGLILTYAGLAQPDDMIFKHITRNNGLPVEGITCLAQDSSGFIWIGSNEGLYRYDGFNFQGYYHDPKNPNSIPGNAITYICVTRTGLIWIATFEGGIACLDRNGKILRVINSSNAPAFSKQSDLAHTIKEDKQGNIWCSTSDGFFLVAANDSVLSCFKLNTSEYRDNAFNDFVFDAAGKIWISNINFGILIFDPVMKSFSHQNKAPFNFKTFQNKNYFNAIALYQKKLWYSTWVVDIGVYDTAIKKDIILYSSLGTIIKSYSRIANVFYIDSKNNLWTATSDGLFFTSHSTSFERSFFNAPDNRHSIINNWITSILEDREGNFWFGTKEGISIAQPFKKQILNLSVHNQKQFPFGNKEISNVIEVDSNTLLVCTTMADGIYETDLDFRVKKRFKFNTAKYDWIWKYYDDKPRHRIFISTQEGMLLYNTRTHEVKKVKADQHFNINTISSFVATSDSIMWMSRFRNSFLKYNLKTDTYKEYRLEELGEKKQNLTLSKDKDNNLWILAHATGIFKFNDSTEKITERLISNNSVNSLLQPALWIFRDLGTNYLIGYQSKGISLYNKKNKTYRHLGRAEGLASNNTREVFVTPGGKVWIATLNGISLFDPGTLTFKNYGFDKGILQNFNISITQLKDGRIVAGTDRGLVVFDPKTVDVENILPPPLITEINIYGKTVSPDKLLQQNTPLEISYKENYFSFDFISPKYNNFKQIQYAYMLEGLDKDWIECGTRRFASYSNLKGGTYLLKIKSRLPGGQWIENKNYLSVDVSAPFYIQWWFYLICVLVLAAIVYTVFRYRLQQVLKMERLRSTISGDLHDEVGSSLTSISIFSEMARKLISPKSKEDQLLERIGDRSRDSIEKMSDIIWSINPDNDSLQQILIRMKNYATEISEVKDIEVHWEEDGDLAYSGLSVEQRKNFYLLFKEVINNAVKHAAAQNIWIELKSAQNIISLELKDDGKGFDTSVPSKGNGLKNIYRRAGLLRGDVKIISELYKGTSVQLAFRY